MVTKSFIDKYVSETIFQHGNEFFLSAQRLTEFDDHKTAPVAVCYALSIELFIKSLEATTKMKHEISQTWKLHEETLVKPKRGGHNLIALFDHLQPEIRNEINVNFKATHHREFRDELEKVSTVFVDWRYQYEGTTYVLHATTLEDIAIFMSEYVSKKVKEQNVSF
jgi:hypothetical protein